MIPMHTPNYLNNHIAKPNTLSGSQFSFRRRFQTTGHSIGLVSKRTLHPSSYVLYLDLSKAFNSVVHSTLFKLLAKAGFPQEFVDMVKRLYRAPLDTPSVNRHRLASHLQLRGLRQGCPLSPSLQAAFEVMVKQAAPYGMIINVGKSKLHTWGEAPHATVYVRHQGKLFSLSTISKDGVPHTFYKYLGIFFFADHSPRVMFAHYLAVLESFFAALSDMVFLSQGGNTVSKHTAYP